MRLLFKLILLVVCCGFYPVFAEAKLHIDPSLRVEEEYTDNLFLAHTDEEEDWITTILPGVRFTLENRVADLSLDYSYHLSFYKNNSDRNENDFAGSQRANLGTTFFTGRPFTLGVHGSISRETLDERDNNSPENELINKSTVYSFSVNPQYRFRFGGQSSLVFGYIYDQTEHEDSRGNDSQGHTGTVSFVKELSTHTEVSANYRYMAHISEDDEDYDEQSYTVGLNQQLGPRTTISLEGGISYIEYEDTGLEEDSLTLDADIEYQLSGAVTLSLSLSQDFDDSYTEGLAETRDGAFRVNYDHRFLNAGISFFMSESDYVQVNRDDKSYGVRLNVNYDLASNLSADFEADYEKSEFEGDVVKDEDHYSLGASLDYEVSRFLVSLGYRYRNNDSDVDVDDYTENRVTLSGTVRF